MSLESIETYKDEESIRGDIARELIGIINDYQAGSLTKEEKDELVEQVSQTYLNTTILEDEETARWFSNVVTVVAALA